MASDPTGGASSGGLNFGGGGLSSSTFSYAGGAVSDIFAAKYGAAGLQIKAGGDIAEAQAYDKASALARLNEQYTEESTALKDMQLQREITMNLGGQQAAVASSGFEETGSALDLLRDSAAQGALTKAVAQQQGLITEAGYKEQAESYDIMSAAAKSTASEEMALAAKEKSGSGLSAGLKGAASGASAGAAFGPWGAVIGGVAGGLMGYFGSK